MKLSGFPTENMSHRLKLTQSEIVVNDNKSNLEEISDETSDIKPVIFANYNNQKDFSIVIIEKNSGPIIRVNHTHDVIIVRQP